MCNRINTNVMNPEMFRKIRKLYLKAYEHSTALQKPALCLSRNGRAQGCVLFGVCFHRQNATLDFLLIDFFFWSSASFSHWNCIWCDGKRVETICRKTCPRPTHIYQSIAGSPWDRLPLGVGPLRDEEEHSTLETLNHIWYWTTDLHTAFLSKMTVQVSVSVSTLALDYCSRGNESTLEWGSLRWMALSPLYPQPYSRTTYSL